MSIKTSADISLYNNIEKGRVLPSNLPDYRNPSWLTLPSITSSDEKFIALFKVSVENNANYVALSFTGNYTVNWGDGNIENFSSGSTAYHQFLYSNSVLDNTNAPVTIEDSTNTINRSSHGYTNGMTIKLYNIVTTTGIDSDTIYYVINATTNSFQISLTSNGSAVDLVNNGTATLLNYKQSIIQVYPQNGASITFFNIHIRHSVFSAAHEVGYLELIYSLPNATNFWLAVPSDSTNSVSIFYNFLEYITILSLSANLSNFYGKFYNLRALKKVIIPNTTFNNASLNSLSYLFSGCYSLTTIDSQLNFPNVTNLGNTFTSCYKLIKLESLNVGVVNTTLGAFQNCYNLVEAPFINITTVGTPSVSSMFYNCTALKTIPQYNFSAVTSLSNMFTSCFSLEYIPDIYAPNCTNITSLFYSCYNLKKSPRLVLGAITGCDYLYYNCYSLTSIPNAFNLTGTTNASNMFFNCSSLKTLPDYNFYNVTNTNSMFYGCASIKNIDNIILPKYPVNAASMFYNCSSLEKISGIDFINVTSTMGTFQSCYNLKELSDVQLNMPSNTNASNMFTGCSNIANIPKITTSSLLTSCNSMFSSCSSITSINSFNTSACTNMTSMFSSCYRLISIPSFDCGAISSSTSFSSFCSNCYSLEDFNAYNIKYSISITTATLLNSTVLNKIYGNLITTTGQTITVTGCIGSTTDDPTIATAKGWTVV